MMERKQMYETFDNSTAKLLNTLPQSILQKNYSSNQTQQMYNCIFSLHRHNKPEELNQFFKEVGVDKDIWISFDSHDDKSDYVFKALNKSIEEGLKKLASKTHAVNNQVQESRNNKVKGKDFEWLNLQTKNEMLKEKLKTKLVQTINEFKNEKKLRETIGKQLDQNEKIHLEEEDYEQLQAQKIKMQYDWTSQDQQLFLTNIQKLKQKFIATQFLKNCHRYKFISNKELATLASEEISRKLDKTNKAFLSREFLLDKYFSTRETLTQNEMKFILKTSPLLGKCVDKAFVKAAVKNICYDDIDKMELQIAQEIIKRFETIRNLVRESRKSFKQNNNMIAKSKIKQFQVRKRKQEEGHSKQQAFKKHKVKMLRKMNCQQKKQNIYKEENSKIFVKRTWPIPLNNAHPPTGLFVKDCNQQCNDDILNEYEKNYLDQVNYCTSKAKTTPSEMIKFYTGGPSEKTNFITEKSQLKIICQAFKTAFYRKQIQNKLINYEAQCQTIIPTERKTNKSLIMGQGFDFGIRKTVLKIEQAEKMMKQKIVESNAKVKTQVFIKKLLSAASQNNFLSFKALGAKFTGSQINRRDKKNNTALFYAVKNKNIQFIDYILSFKGDVNLKCSKGMTPLHKAFQSNNYALICKCMMGAHQPDLNAIDDEGKTPLGYCTRKILEMLNLENGVVCVEMGVSHKFDNNKLLQRERHDLVRDEEIEIKACLKKH